MDYRHITLCTLLLLAACGKSEKEEVPAPPPKLFAEQQEALDQAKTVNATQQEQDEKQRKAIEQQTQ